MFLLWKGALSSFGVEVIQEGIVPWSPCCLEEIDLTLQGLKDGRNLSKVTRSGVDNSEKDNSTLQ